MNSPVVADSYPSTLVQADWYEDVGMPFYAEAVREQLHDYWSNHLNISVNLSASYRWNLRGTVSRSRSNSCYLSVDDYSNDFRMNRPTGSKSKSNAGIRAVSISYAADQQWFRYYRSLYWSLTASKSGSKSGPRSKSSSSNTSRRAN